MNSESSELWQKIRAFELDTPGAAFPFSRKLAREQGWTAEFTARVIEEYRRFLFLGVSLEQPVSPSPAVDQAWHLHLTYTRSYWDRLCGEVLGRPFHHMPSEGREGEAEKYQNWYARTLRDYARVFGEAPPDDIWPPADDSDLKAKGRFRAWNWWAKPTASKCEVTSLSRISRFPVIAGLLTFSLSATGCTEAGDSVNVFDWRGPEFLLFYAVLFFGLLFASFVLRHLLKVPGGIGDELPEDLYLWAWLSGGCRRAVMAALTTLSREGLIYVGHKGKTKFLREPDVELHPFENGVLDSIRAQRDSFEEIMEDAKVVGEPLQEELEKRELLMSPERQSRVLRLPRLLMGVALVVGGVKLVVGINRDAPVAFLVVALILSVVVIGICHRLAPQRSRRGDATLVRMRKTHEHLKHKPKPGPEEMGAAVALFGPVVLSGTALAVLYDMPNPGESWVTWGGGCGSSCGGGGGGDGGGGCGGCGGD